jgi:5-methylcytosine-specific restriction endonuclease McrA
MIIEICKECGKSFSTYPSLNRNYCNRICMGKYRSKHFIGKIHPNFVERIQKECQVCGKPFLITPYYLKVKKYCSRKCKAIVHSKMMSGENNPSWKGGIGEKFQRWGKGFTTHLKKQVKARNNYTCQICKLPEKESKVKFVIHHIDKISKNNVLSNLILLCNPCHISLHHKIGKAII